MNFSLNFLNVLFSLAYLRVVFNLSSITTLLVTNVKVLSGCDD